MREIGQTKKAGREQILNCGSREEAKYIADPISVSLRAANAMKVPRGVGAGKVSIILKLYIDSRTHNLCKNL